MVDILRDVSLQDSVDSVVIHTPETMNSNRVIIWLKQSHAEQQVLS